MRILSLELQNIKSYREATRIDFTSGLNAVCGLNGSGKTTVLEAIGFVLFDYLPYNRDAFVREGEKSGTIRLRLIAGDGREYEVARKVGSGGQYYVVDVETNTRLAERGPNVLQWVQEHALGIDGQADLSSLFEHAVGVPQGLMTSHFLGNATQRKSIFDPLLRVEEYHQAWETLRETMSYLKDRTANVSEEIARLEAETDRIPGLQENVAELQDKVEGSATHVARLESALHDSEARKGELDEIEVQLFQLRSDLQGAQYDVRRFGDALSNAQSLLDSAHAAHQAVLAAEPGYHLKVAATERLMELDEQRSERDGLRAAQAKVKGQLDGTRRQIDRLNTDIKDAETAALASQALQPEVGHQADLEREQSELLATLKVAGDLDGRLKSVESDVATLERETAAREARMGEARAARAESAGLPETRERVRGLGAKLAQLEPIRRQREQVEREGKELKAQAMRLTEDVRKRDALRAELERLLPAVTALESLRARQGDLRDERAQLIAAVEYQAIARKQLEEQQCPLLELRCPVVASNVSVLDRFDSRFGDLESRRSEIDAVLADVNREVAAAEKASKECQDLQVRIAQLDPSDSRLAEIRASLDDCVSRHNELSVIVAGEAEVRSAHEAALAEERRLDEAFNLGQRLDDLESRQADELRRLTTLRTDLEALREQGATVLTFRERVDEISAELTELGDPRARQAELEAIAARRDDLLAQLEREEARRAEDEERFKELVEALQPFETLDAEIAEQRQIEATHRPAYETYIQNKAEAGQVYERETAVQTAGSELDEARKREAEIVRQGEETAARYDAERHAELKRECKEVGEKLAAERTNLAHLRDQLATAERELDRLKVQQRKLLARQAERDELGRVTSALTFIRETIRAAGPAVTETLLAHISQGANDIYSEIMDDHTVELRWDRDYEVLSQRGPETRKFNQLSGGEQMSAALAVRLALLKEMSEVDFAFFDEPTQNMDGERRTNLAGQIREIRGFEQLIVISHDDTFEHHTDNLIRLQKIHEETQLETS